MRICLFFIFCLFSCLEMSGQYKEVSVPIYNDVVTLHSALHFGVGVESRKYISIQIPPNTVRWYYSFSAKNTQSEANNSKNQSSLLSSLANASTHAVASLVSSGLQKTASSVDCSVYLLNSSSDINNFLKNNHYSIIKYCSREGFVSAQNVIVDGGHFLEGMQYLAIVNNNWQNAIYVNIQVVAVVQEPITDNGWTIEDKQRFHDVVKQMLVDKGALNKTTNDKLEDFLTCLIEYLKGQYSADEYNSLAQYEKTNAIKKGFSQCKELSGLQ